MRHVEKNACVAFVAMSWSQLGAGGCSLLFAHFGIANLHCRVPGKGCMHSAHEYFRINKVAKSQPHEKCSRLFLFGFLPKKLLKDHFNGVLSDHAVLVKVY